MGGKVRFRYITFKRALKSNFYYDMNFSIWTNSQSTDVNTYYGIFDHKKLML